jgi:hypothetical protein
MNCESYLSYKHMKDLYLPTLLNTGETKATHTTACQQGALYLEGRDRQTNRHGQANSCLAGICAAFRGATKDERLESFSGKSHPS